MKNLFLILVITVLSIPITFAQSQKTFVKSMTADASTVIVNLEGETKVSEWSEKFIRITTTVQVTNSSEEILKRLVLVGRYAISSEVVDGQMRINMPKLATKVTIRGEFLDEELTYHISVPKGVTVELSADATTTIDVN
jgi:hypothetical protein